MSRLFTVLWSNTYIPWKSQIYFGCICQVLIIVYYNYKIFEGCIRYSERQGTGSKWISGWKYTVGQGYSHIKTPMLELHGHINSFHRLGPEKSKKLSSWSMCKQWQYAQKISTGFFSAQMFTAYTLFPADPDPIRLAKSVSVQLYIITLYPCVSSCNREGLPSSLFNCR